MWRTIIKDIMSDRDLKLEEIGKYAGVSKEAVRKLLTGQTREPRFGIGRKLCELHLMTEKRNFSEFSELQQDYDSQLKRINGAEGGT